MFFTLNAAVSLYECLLYSLSHILHKKKQEEEDI